MLRSYLLVVIFVKVTSTYYGDQLLNPITDPTVYYQRNQIRWLIDKEPPNDEQRLLRHLMYAYDKSVRPVYRAKDKVTVAVGLTLTHIFNVDEKKQVLTINAWLDQIWHDERLVWSPIDFNNISYLTIPAHFLWLPDIVLYNNAHDFARGMAQTNVAVQHDGTVYRLPPVKFHSMCKLDVSYFPFDDQICYLHFGSWVYDATQVDVINKTKDVTTDEGSFTENGEWAIIETTVRRHLRRPFSGFDSLYPGLTFALHLRRRALFFLYNIVFPCVMLSILTLIQFWLPCESGEKVTLGLTVLLAYSVFSFNIAENMPETSEVIPLIGIYLMCIMGISAVSVTLSVVVLNVRDGGERKARVPLWLHFLTYNIIAKLIFWSRVRPVDNKHHDISFHEAVQSLGEQMMNNDEEKSNLHNINNELLNTTELVTAPGTMVSTSTESSKKAGNRPDRPPYLCPPTSIRRYRRSKTSIAAVNFADELARNASTSSEQREILCRAGRLMDRIENEQESDYLQHEWRKVSRIFDSFFFLIIFLATALITVILLVAAPRFSARNLLDETMTRLEAEFGTHNQS